MFIQGDTLSNDGHLDQHVGKLAQIKYLRLFRLNSLNQLWKQDSKMDSIFQSVENVVLNNCDNLLILLLSSSVSFLQEVDKLNDILCSKKSSGTCKDGGIWMQCNDTSCEK